VSRASNSFSARDQRFAILFGLGLGLGWAHVDRHQFLAWQALLQHLTARGHRPHAELRVAKLGPEAGIVGAGDLARDRDRDRDR